MNFSEVLNTILHQFYANDRRKFFIPFVFQSLFGFGQSCEVEIDLDGQESRKTVEARSGTTKQLKLLVFYNGETVGGKVSKISTYRLTDVLCLAVLYI